MAFSWKLLSCRLPLSEASDCLKAIIIQTTPSFPSSSPPYLRNDHAVGLTEKIIGLDNSLSILKAHILLLHGLELRNVASLWSATVQTLIITWPLVFFPPSQECNRHLQ